MQTKTAIIAVAMVVIMAAAAIGAGYAYTASTSNSGNTATDEYLTITPGNGNDNEFTPSFTQNFDGKVLKFGTITGANTDTSDTEHPYQIAYTLDAADNVVIKIKDVQTQVTNIQAVELGFIKTIVHNQNGTAPEVPATNAEATKSYSIDLYIPITAVNESFTYYYMEQEVTGDTEDAKQKAQIAALPAYSTQSTVYDMKPFVKKTIESNDYLVGSVAVSADEAVRTIRIAVAAPDHTDKLATLPVAPADVKKILDAATVTFTVDDDSILAKESTKFIGATIASETTWKPAANDTLSTVLNYVSWGDAAYTGVASQDDGTEAINQVAKTVQWSVTATGATSGVFKVSETGVITCTTAPTAAGSITVKATFYDSQGTAAGSAEKTISITIE